MAVGTVTGRDNVKRAICLMTGQTANTNPPSDTAEATEAEGVPAYGAKTSDIWHADDKGAFYLGEPPEYSTLVISSSAGSDTMTGTFVLWCYCAYTATWIPKNVNGGNAIAETATDKIRYSETFEGLGTFDRFFLELKSVGGTATAFEAWLITPRAAP